jgi:hypothetical protein
MSYVEAPFEMANLFPKHTSLPFVVWISYRGGALHDVRVKVSRNAKAIPAEMISVAIRPDVHIVEGSMDSGESTGSGNGSSETVKRSLRTEKAKSIPRTRSRHW